MVEERLERSDFTYSVQFGGTAFVMAKPSMEIQWQAVFCSLSGLVWAAVATSTIAVAASLWLVSTVNCFCSALVFKCSTNAHSYSTSDLI